MIFYTGSGTDVTLPAPWGSVFAALSFWYVAKRIPETRGMALEQAETLFSR